MTKTQTNISSGISGGRGSVENCPYFFMGILKEKRILKISGNALAKVKGRCPYHRPSFPITLVWEGDNQ
jgi:hypothetical protein